MSAPWVISEVSEAGLAHVAGMLATSLKGGDVVALHGDLGAGKTSFARTLIRLLAGADMEVPSPTFTLVQCYELDRVTVAHFDLYRLGGSDDLEELGWSDLTETAVSLVEWPEHAGAALPAERIDVRLDFGKAGDTRTLRLTGHGAWAERLDRLRKVAAFLDSAGWGGARRRYLHGDASTRAYERLARNGERAVLMNAPATADGPPIRGGRPYSAIAKLAEDIVPFLAIGQGLRQRGVHAPQIHAFDIAKGLIVMEDLGGDTLVGEAGPIEARYKAASELLAHMHGLDWPARIAVAGNGVYELPAYDEEALLIEAELLLDWYLPAEQGAPVGEGLRSSYLRCWRQALAGLDGVEPVWTLRDFHSPNLIWLGERRGSDAGQSIGVIDFQDALLGHPAYDLVSLLQDARVDIPADMEERLFEHYCAKRGPELDRQALEAAYALLGAQRNSKILGIFARLSARDGKHGYLGHLPRIRRYLTRDLAHPALADLRGWYAAHAPQALSEDVATR